MHKFLVILPNGQGPLERLHGAHLLGNEGIPIRGEAQLVDGQIHCTSRTRDPFALSLLWPVEGFGAIQLETTRLPVRAQPYLLNFELARHRLMRITLKREEWGLFDYHGMEDIAAEIEQARALFIEAWEASDDPPRCARLADESLRHSLWAGEHMCQFHASVFLGRRQQSGGFAREFLGTAISPQSSPRVLTPGLCKTLDFVRIPFTWRQVQPEEQVTDFSGPDAWVKACKQAKVAAHGGPLLNFGVRSVPDWMYIWENDFDTIREYAREHVQRCVKRYAKQISSWVVASGLHADNVFSFNFEQIMEITRMAATTARDLAPRAAIILDLTQPWGEYSARNQRSIPPLLFADMAVQSGIPFDTFGLQFLFGIGSEGYRLRDLLQISALIDKLANLGKSLHVTAVAVPSASEDSGSFAANGGQWRQPWSAETQADWLRAFCEIALSKPYVESVCLHGLTDDRGSTIPTGGVLTEDFSPKTAFQRLAELYQQLTSAPSQ